MRIKVIIFTIVTILSLVMILMSYFEFDRYIVAHFSSPEKLLEKYGKLKKGDGRIVVSFTTTPDKVGKLKPMINSLLDQTVRIDEIALNIPRGVPYDFPVWLKKIVNVYYTGKDFGSGAKVVPTLRREGEKDTVIIYVEDGKVFGKDFIESLLKESQEKPNKAIYTKEPFGECVLIKPEFFSSCVVDENNDKYSDDWLEKNLIVKTCKFDYKENYCC